MQDQEFSIGEALKAGPANAQTARAYAEGLVGWVRLGLSAAILTVLSASCWGRCVLRWKPGLAMVGKRHLPAFVVLGIVSQFYLSTEWRDVFEVVLKINLLMIGVHLVMGLVRLMGTPRTPVHSDSPGEPSPLFDWLWRLTLCRDGFSELRVALIGEPILVFLLAAGVRVIELTVLPAPADRWPISVWVCLVGISMMGETVWVMLMGRWRVTQMIDHDIEQQEIAADVMQQRSTQQERHAEGVSQIPLVEIPAHDDVVVDTDEYEIIETESIDTTGDATGPIEVAETGDAGR